MARSVPNLCEIPCSTESNMTLLGVDCAKSRCPLRSFISDTIASWIDGLFQHVSDHAGLPERVIPLDHLIDDIILYWLPNAGPCSARFYWEAAHEMAKGMPSAPVPLPLPLPAVVSMFPREQIRLSRRWAEARIADLRYFRKAASGGHFAAMENAETFVEHVRATFRTT